MAPAQTPPPEGSAAPPMPEAVQPVFSQQDLDQMLAPIALYPDALLSQILMAATYPLEVVEAARWSRANPNLKGEQAVNAVAQNDWDPSVKSLVAFPQIIQMMDEKLNWMERLGDAFLSQEAQVMDTIQKLRRRAYDAGNLESSDEIDVEPEGQDIAIEPANPYAVYVPYYDPTLIYGPWWWPAYPPVYWGPWPGYYVGPVITVGFFYGLPVRVPPHFFFGACNWHARSINVTRVNNSYFNYNTYVSRQMSIYRVVNSTNAGVAWKHDPIHRRGVPYRSIALRQEFGHTSQAPDTRREFRGYASPSQGSPGHIVQQNPRGGGAISPNQSLEQHGNTRSIVGSTAPRQATTVPGRSNAPLPSTSRMETHRIPAHRGAPITQRPNAFQDIGDGARVRNYSARGRESFQPAAPRPSIPGAPSPGHVPAGHPQGNVVAPHPAGSPGGGGTIRR